MKYIFIVYTTDGREFKSSTQELDNVNKVAFIEMFSDLKNLKHFAMGVVDALGRENKVYFHPEKIVAIRLTEATLSTLSCLIRKLIRKSVSLIGQFSNRSMNRGS